jgi:excisionase family DNA binding protein
VLINLVYITYLSNKLFHDKSSKRSNNLIHQDKIFTLCQLNGKNTMHKEIQYYNSIEAAKILGVNVSTIKRWTDDGRLECIRTAGGHRKFIMSHLSEFLDQNRKKRSKINLFPLENETDLKISNHILKGDFFHLIEYLQKQAFNCNRDRVQKVFNGLYLAQYPLYVIYDQIVTPILRDTGKLWINGKIDIIQEHLATSTLRDAIKRLQGIISLPKAKKGKALCLNLSNEMHDIALKMVDHILENRGFKVLYSGQNTPIINFEKILKSFKPDRIYISSSYIEDIKAAQEEFDYICDCSAKAGINIYIGGAGFDQLNYDHLAVAQRLHTFEEIHKI